VSRKRARVPAVEARDDGPWLDPAEVGPKLLLFGLPESAQLEPTLCTGAVAAFVLTSREIDERVRAACQRHRLSLLLLGDAAAARAAEVDGVHVARPDQVTPARAQMGRGRLVGASCGMSRHDAMLAGEAGADYVLFGSPDAEPTAKVAELVGWWSELFVLPCAAAGIFSAESARSMAAAGADFIATHQANVELAQALVTIGSP
jgi:thiamine-phosphate pyrophosphorylase